MPVNNNSIEGVTKASVSKMDPVSIPGFGPAVPGDINPAKFSIRYLKIDMDDPGAVTELEILETKSIRNEGVFILNKDKFTFMDKYFLIVSYMEEDRNANSGS